MNRLPIICALLISVTTAGCRQVPAIRTGNASVVGNANAGRPATLDSSTTTSEMPVPEDSVVTVTRTDATPTSPAVETREIRVVHPTRLTDTTVHVRADTGTVDQSVAIRMADNKERRILLYAAIGAALLGIVARVMLPSWPSISRSMLMAAVLFAGAWKFAEIPWWVGLVALGVVALIIVGYRRAEWDANRNGIPDIFEKTKKP